jgi:hypothetical protein
MHTETGRVISAEEMERMRAENRLEAENYAPLPRRLSRAAQRLLDRGERYPTAEKDLELLAHAAKLRKRRQRLEKAGRKRARKGK